MWIVAGYASLYSHSRVLEYIGSALFHVALYAGFRTGIVETGHILRTVRIVAVRTLHEPFWDAMVLGKSKFRFDRLVAAIANGGLGLL